MFKPKQGEMILAGQYNPVEREFMTMDGGGYVCRGRDGTGYGLWATAKPLPTKPEPIPYTHEAWPKQVVWLRRNDWRNGEADMVIGLYDGGVNTDDRCTDFDESAKTWDISLDFCATWQPCHYVLENE